MVDHQHVFSLGGRIETGTHSFDDSFGSDGRFPCAVWSSTLSHSVDNVVEKRVCNVQVEAYMWGARLTVNETFSEDASPFICDVTSVPDRFDRFAQSTRCPHGPSVVAFAPAAIP